MKNKIKKFLVKGNLSNQDNCKSAGITLVALIITIVVLLILAGITIAQLSGNGLFENAKIAKEKYHNAQEREDLEIAKYSNEINNYVNGNRGTVTLTEEEYEIFKNQSTFSTEEKKVGIWTDGKPLYQKIINGTIPSNNSTSEWTEAATVSGDLDKCVSLSTSVYYPDAGYYFANYCNDDLIHKVSTSGKLCFITHNTNFRNKQYYTIVQYTKTTD